LRKEVGAKGFSNHKGRFSFLSPPRRYQRGKKREKRRRGDNRILNIEKNVDQKRLVSEKETRSARPKRGQRGFLPTISRGKKKKVFPEHGHYESEDQSRRKRKERVGVAMNERKEASVLRKKEGLHTLYFLQRMAEASRDNRLTGSLKRVDNYREKDYLLLTKSFIFPCREAKSRNARKKNFFLVKERFYAIKKKLSTRRRSGRKNIAPRAEKRSRPETVFRGRRRRTQSKRRSVILKEDRDKGG